MVGRNWTNLHFKLISILNWSHMSCWRYLGSMNSSKLCFYLKTVQFSSIIFCQWMTLKIINPQNYSKEQKNKIKKLWKLQDIEMVRSPWNNRNCYLKKIMMNESNKQLYIILTNDFIRMARNCKIVTWCLSLCEEIKFWFH